MGLFTGNKTEHTKHKQGADGPISSIIAEKMRVTGEIVFKGKTRIDGSLEGDIKGEYLILSETGRIKGNLKLDTLVCHGAIQGDIQANTITAHQTASIRGKLASGNLTVEPGAAIEGEIHAVNRRKTDSPQHHATRQDGAAGKKETIRSGKTGDGEKKA